MNAVFSAVGVFQRLVLLDQRALGVLGVGDVDIGEQRAAVGQRQHGASEHAAVEPVELLFVGHALRHDGRHRLLDALPILGRVIEHAAPGDDLLDMRLAVELARVQPPDGGEGAVDTAASRPLGANTATPSRNVSSVSVCTSISAL